MVEKNVGTLDVKILNGDNMKKLLLNSKNGLIRLCISSWYCIAIYYVLKYLLIIPFALHGVLPLFFLIPLILILAVVGNNAIDVIWKKYIHE